MSTPHWHSQSKVDQVATDFAKFAHVLFGLYVYEWFLSLDFEWEFITGRRRFTWPMVFYFANRYCLLVAMIVVIIMLNAETHTRKLNCTALLVFIQVGLAAAIGLASINFSIRTIAIWSSNKYIVGGFILATIGQWSLLILQVERLRFKWHSASEVGLACALTGGTNIEISAAILIYAMAYDLVVLLLTTYKLFVNHPSKMLAQSRLIQVMYMDGIIFFIVAFLGNLLAAIFTSLNLNIFMTLIFAVLAPVLSTIMACRAVRRLKNSDAEPTVANAVPFPLGLFNKHGNRKKKELPGVHITTERYVHRDGEYQPSDPERSLNMAESGSDIVMKARDKNRELSVIMDVGVQ